jgi:hypothetical protein
MKKTTLVEVTTLPDSSRDTNKDYAVKEVKHAEPVRVGP